MAITPHRFSRISPNIIGQMDSPSGSVDARFSSVRSNGINQNHGWKIHADFVTNLTYEEGLAKAGRAADLSIIDQNLAGEVNKRLAGLGVSSDDFFKFYKSGYKGFGLSKGANYVDPNDLLTAAEVFEEHGISYKIGLATYGEGRHISAYPQSLENRDSLIKSLEDKLGDRLIDQNNPAYRAALDETGIKNHPISRGVSGRFTTDYLDVNPKTGQVDFSLSNEAGAIPEEYRITGKINPEEIKKINRVTAEMPEMAELLHGQDGYISPYKTIEQIAEERSTGKIPTTNVPLKDRIDTTFDEFNYRGPLPAISRPGSVATGAAATMPSSGPSLDAIKAAMGDSLPSSVEANIPKNLTPQQQAFIDSMKAEKAANEAFAVESLGKTKQAVEESGYLYHYAPRDARDSILSGGLQTSRARTAVADVSGAFSEFSTHVPDNSMYFFTNPNDAPSAGIIFGYEGSRELPDLYRVKATPEMLEGMIVDPRLAIRDGVASAVIVPSKSGSFAAELIGENAKFAMPARNADPELAISPATYDKVATKLEAKVTSEDVVSRPTGEPVAKEHSPRKIAALEEMAENGTVHEKEIAKRKLEEIKNTQNRVRGSGLNIGTPTDDIRTRPTPKGTDAASRSVVDSGGTRPIINVEPPKPDTIKPPVDKPADVSAKITTDSTTPVKNVPDTSSRITKITSTGRTIKDNGMNVAKNISSGNARTMGIAAIAGLLGAGAYGLNKKKEEDIQSRVNRQRYGEM
jgi:hypothetical protein